MGEEHTEECCYNGLGQLIQMEGKNPDANTSVMEYTVDYSNVENLDAKKIATGLLVTATVATVVVASGGSAAPVLLAGFACGTTNAAVFAGITYKNGGSVEDMARSASDGFLWGNVTGSVGAGLSMARQEAVPEFSTELR